MPYIPQTFREMLKSSTAEPKDVGELNYKITTLIHRYIETKGLRYEHINAVVGVLECAKQELYRMVASPYEDGKHRENGSISSLDRLNIMMEDSYDDGEE